MLFADQSRYTLASFGRKICIFVPVDGIERYFRHFSKEEVCCVIVLEGHGAESTDFVPSSSKRLPMVHFSVLLRAPSSFCISAFSF